MENLILVIGYTLISALSYSQSDVKHPIDIKREKCLNDKSGQTTSGMIQCEKSASDLWDKQLFEYYDSLLSIISREEQVALKDSQLKWLEYRKKETVFATMFYGNMEGTMWQIFIAGKVCSINRARALELKEYIDVLSGEY